MVLLYYFCIISHSEYNFNTTFCKKSCIFFCRFVLFARGQMSSQKSATFHIFTVPIRKSKHHTASSVVFFVKARGRNIRQIVSTS